MTLKPFPCCRTTRGQKRKLDDVHEDDDEHAGFDAAQLREHEEFTKVKNVAKIELGRYEMETWYFSPLPDEFKGCTVSACACAISWLAATQFCSWDSTGMGPSMASWF